MEVMGGDNGQTPLKKIANSTAAAPAASQDAGEMGES